MCLLPQLAGSLLIPLLECIIPQLAQAGSNVALLPLESLPESWCLYFLPWLLGGAHNLPAYSRFWSLEFGLFPHI